VLCTPVIASVVDGVGKDSLKLLRDGLLDPLGDDGCVAPIFGMGLTARTGTGIVNLGNINIEC